MRNEIQDNDLDLVAGGNYYLNKNNGKLAFTTIKGVTYQLKNCTPGQATDVMDGLIGKYNSTEEYDQACVSALKKKGWI